MKRKKINRGDKEEHHHHHHYSDLFGLGLCKIPLISKDSNWKRIFDLFMILLAIYSTTINVYTAAFGIIKNDFIYYWDYLVTFLFTIEFIFNLFQEYQDEVTYEIEMHHLPIMINYMKTTGILDLIALIPFNLIFREEY